MNLFIIGGALGLLLLGGMFFILIQVLARNGQNQIQNGFRLIQDNFESLQRNLLVQQQESERSNDAKTSMLRTELSQELQTNRRELQQGLMQTSLAMEQRVAAIDSKIDGRLKEMNLGVQQKLEQNVKEGFKHFEKVQEHLHKAELQLLNLNSVGQSINDLNNLLKLPHLRGSFGEATLERLLSDMLPADGFELQYKIGPNSTERVDAVIRYPKFVLPIDSKFPREQVLPLFETNDPIKLEEARKNLLEVMRGLGKSIRDKYIHPEHGTAEMALLFVPSETLYFECIRNAKLCEELGKFKVFPVSPNTLAVTLNAVAMAREYYDMSRGVESTIAELKKANSHLGHFEKKFDDVGNSLAKAQTAFNTASTHLSRYQSAITRLNGPEEISPPNESASLPLPEQTM